MKAPVVTTCQSNSVRRVPPGVTQPAAVRLLGFARRGDFSFLRIRLANDAATRGDV
jgi:hypothetical protein